MCVIIDLKLLKIDFKKSLILNRYCFLLKSGD